MSTIVTRAGKGSPLTHTEVDNNFTNLNTDKVETSGGTLTNPTINGNVSTTGINIDSNTLVIDATNNAVGIGGNTTGTVAGVPITSKFCVKNEGDAPVAGFVHANNTTASSGSITFACRSRGTLASPSSVQNNDSLWNMYIAGHDGTDLALGAEIAVEVDGTPSGNDMPARIVIKTTPDGSQIPEEAMRIDSTQTVNIGKAVISTSLNVTGTASFDGSQGTSGQVLTSAGTGNTPTWTTPKEGTVTSVGGTGTVNGITLSGTVTSSGSLTLGGTLSNVSLATQVTGTLPVANGGTGITTTPTNGQIPIGNGTNYTAATITAGANIAVTNGAGSISIATNIPTPQVTVYTSGSGTYTVPANTKYVTVRMIGGGGNGGGSTGTTAGGGGGAGGYLEGIITSLSSTYSYAVGAAGGNTTFGSSLFTANAGSAGTSSSATASGGTGGSASGGSVNATGATGGFGWASSPYFNGGMGAASPFGAGGSGGGTGFGNGFAAVSYGSGGGGAVGGGGAGTGSGGLIIVTAYF